MPVTNLIKELLFPKFCVGCGRWFTFLCESCFEQVEFFTLPQTPQLNPLYLDQLIAATYFQPPISHLIKVMKYQHVKEIGLTCGRLLYETTNFPSPTFITAVPLHPQRKQERGFNQAEVIGQELARLMNLPYFNLLKRIKSVPHQASIEDKVKRKTNVSNIFAVNNLANWPTLDNHRPTSVLIVDDVTTTGATLNECAKVLKENGIQKVYGLTVAHGG